MMISKISDAKSQSAEYTQIGHRHIFEGRYHNAISDYTNAIRLDPHNTEAHLGKATVYSELKFRGKALKEFDMAISLARENGEVTLLCLTYLSKAAELYAAGRQEEERSTIEALKAVKDQCTNHRLRFVLDMQFSETRPQQKEGKSPTFKQMLRDRPSEGWVN